MRKIILIDQDLFYSRLMSDNDDDKFICNHIAGPVENSDENTFISLIFFALKS